MTSSHWKGRQLVIATMHGKEQVLGPLMHEHFGMQVILPSDLDTDQFGTFSGEKERLGTPVEVARKKCLVAMEITGVDLGLASEGSFGPHPDLGFITINEEYLILIDKKNNREILAKKVSTDTNLAGQSVGSKDELVAFSERVGFPEHAVILKTDGHKERNIVKGICDPHHLMEEFERLQSKSKKVYAETDMRAMFNPKRMAVIKEAGMELVHRMANNCIQCKSPGFGAISAEPGLPCKGCGFPTSSILYLVRACSVCGYSDHQYYPKDLRYEDPQYCNICNP